LSYINELLRQGKHEELWQMCCGFIDLNVAQFMDIQKRLLLEQIELLKTCRLGRKVMRGAMPETIDEFREQVPLTTYADYCPELLDQSENALPAKPDFWVQTTGRSGEYAHKYIPITHRFWEEAGIDFSAVALFDACKERGKFAFKNGLKLLYGMGPPPYLTGNIACKLGEHLGLQYLPPLGLSEEMSFDERVGKGVKLALADGMDGFFGLAGVLVAIGEKIRQGSGSTKLSSLIFQPKVMLRLARGLIKSKLAGRPMLPKDLWSIKVICCMGTDSTVYKKRVEDLWGRTPVDVYGNSEMTIIATQTWDYDSMVFYPNLNFLEFIPEDESTKWYMDQSYQPKTVLLDEVKAGECYEVVATNFHGGALVRYRVGDIIRITALRNEKLGIDLPQMVFERRTQDFIDLEFIRLTERSIWQAIENTGISYQDWVASKDGGKEPRLKLYLELKGDYDISEEDVAKAVYEQIKILDNGLYVYKEFDSLEKFIDFKPIEVTLLPKGTFANYKATRQTEGSGLAHLKPPHINPSEEALSLLGTDTIAASKI